MMMMPAKQKVALFLGSDVVAHREMCIAVKALLDNHFEPLLFYPKHLPSKNANAGQKIFKDYAFVERLILSDIFNHLNQNPANSKSLPTPEQMCQRYNLAKPQQVDNINDPEFFMSLADDPAYIGGISLRCTQLFGLETTKALKSNGRFLINAHSGLLPNYRGLYATPRAVYDAITNSQNTPNQRTSDFGCTVHHIDPFIPAEAGQSNRYTGIDTGNIIDLQGSPVDPEKTIYATNLDLADLAGQSVAGIIDRLARGHSINGYPQVHEQAQYFSYADPAELKRWDAVGMQLFDREEVADALIEMFSDKRTRASMSQIVHTSLSNYFDGACATHGTRQTSNDNPRAPSVEAPKLRA